MNFTEISMIYTEINVLDHLYNQVETVSETERKELLDVSI